MYKDRTLFLLYTFDISEFGNVVMVMQSAIFVERNRQLHVVLFAENTLSVEATLQKNLHDVSLVEKVSRNFKILKLP